MRIGDPSPISGRLPAGGIEAGKDYTAGPILGLDELGPRGVLGLACRVGWDKNTEFKPEIEIERSDELGELANSFYQMASKLQQSFQELSNSKRQVSYLLEFLPVGVVVHNPDGSIIYFNEMANELMGSCADDQSRGDNE